MMFFPLLRLVVTYLIIFKVLVVFFLKKFFNNRKKYLTLNSGRIIFAVEGWFDFKICRAGKDSGKCG